MRDDSWYDTAQVCVNGHVITTSATTSRALLQPRCSRCGSETITTCPSCGASIHGHYHIPGVFAVGFKEPTPAYCHQCGSAYPWTTSALEAARELADEIDGLTLEEREQLKQTLDDIVRETPRTQVATLRFKRLVAKAGSGTAEMFKQVLVDVVSESVRKVIWGS